MIIPWGRRRHERPVESNPRPELPSSLVKCLRRPFQAPATVIPDDARMGRWEALHDWHPKAMKPIRRGSSIEVQDHPTALICPDCELRQEPLGAGYSPASRTCAYCGCRQKVWGSLIYWWR